MEPTTQQPDSKRRLYDALTKQGLDLGPYDEYSAKMQDPDRAAKLYDSVTSKGYDLGSREQYMTKLYGPSFQSSLRPAEYPLTSGAAGGGSMLSATGSAGSVATPLPSPEPQGPPTSPAFTPQALTQGLAKQAEETGFRPPMPEVQSPARFADISQQVDPLVTRSYRPQTLLTDEQRTQLLKERDAAERTAVTYGEESLFKPRRQVDQAKLNRVAEIDAILKGDEQADPLGSKKAKEMYLAIEGEKTRGRIAPLMFASPEGQQALKRISEQYEQALSSATQPSQQVRYGVPVNPSLDIVATGLQEAPPELSAPQQNVFLNNLAFVPDTSVDQSIAPQDPREQKILTDFDRLAPKIGQRFTQFGPNERRERKEVGAWTSRQEGEYRANAYEFQSRLLHGDLLRITDAIKAGADPAEFRDRLMDIQAGMEYIGQRYRDLAQYDTPTFREKALAYQQLISDIDPNGVLDPGRPGPRTRALIYGGTKAMATAIGGVARLLDKKDGYTPLTAISDWSAEMAATREADIPTALKESTLGSLLDGAGAMYFYIASAAPGGIAGEVAAANKLAGLASAAGKIGTASAVGTMYASEYESFARQAMEQGAPRNVAEAGAAVYAPLASAIEFFNPQLYLAGRKAAMEPVKKQFMSLIKEGMAPRTAMKTAMELADAGTREAIEELGQTLTERGVNMASNAMAGTELNTDISSKEAAETALVSFILGGAASGVNLAATRKERQAQRTKANVEAMHWAMQNPNEAEELIAKVDISEEEKVKAIEKVQRMASIFKGNNLKEKDTEVATNIVEAVAEKKDIEQDIKENPVDPAIEAAVGDPRKREVAEITKEIMSLMEIPQDRARAALAGMGMERVEEKVVKQPDGSVVLESKESKEAPETQPKDEVDAILDEEFAAEPEAAVSGGLPEVPAGTPEATTAIETPQGTGVEVEVGPTGAVTPEATSTVAPAAPDVAIPEPAAPAAQKPKGGKKAVAQAAPAAPTAEPVTSITEVKKSKDGSQVEYKVPGWEDLRIVVQREKGGYAANIMVGDQALKIQPKGKEEGTAKLAILDAKERLDRAGREKISALISSATPKEQRPQDGITPSKTAIDRIENVVKALRSIVPDLVVIVHDTSEEFAADSRRAGGRGIASDAAFYDQKTNAIHLNRQMASDNTLFHEAAHPILLSVLQNNPELFLSLYKQLATDPAFAKYIEFGESYSDKDELTRAAESLAEFMADVAAGKVQFSKEPGSLWQKFVEWLQETLVKVGLDFRAIDLSNPKNVRDFAAKFSRGVREGIKLKGLGEVRRSDGLPLLQEDAQAVVDGWYSRLDQAVAAKGSTMPGPQWGKWLEARAKEGALSLEEAKWTGLNDFLASKGDEKVTPQQVREFLKENRVRVEVVELDDETSAVNRINRAISGTGYYFDQTDTTIGQDGSYIGPDGPLSFDELPDNVRSIVKENDNEGRAAKFSQYQLHGGTNYREVLVTLPKRGASQGELDAMAQEQYGKPYSELNDAQQRNTLSYVQEARKDPEYRSSHFDEPNILVHLRLNDRIGPNGEKILFIEEIQSDWAQQGRKEGFNAPSEKPTNADLQQAAEEAGPNWDGTVPGKRTTPSAPFVTSTDAWVELGLKQAIRMAVEGGYDKIAWTTGEQQNERYDLSKQVDEISWRSPTSTRIGQYKDIRIKMPDGKSVHLSVREDGVVRGADQGDLDGKRLDEVVGKDIADKIMSEESGDLSGDGLKIGGSGMKGFYDKILPTVAKKVSKKLGGDGEVSDAVIGEDIQVGDRIGRQQSISITPEMRQRVSAGVPLMQRPKAIPVDRWNAMVPTIREALKAGMKPKEVMEQIGDLAKGLDQSQKGAIQGKIQQVYDKIETMRKKDQIVDKRISEDDSKKLADAEKLRKSIKKGLKKGAQKRRDVYLNELAKDFTSLRIPKTALDDYINMATAIKDLIRGASVAVSEQSVDALRTDAGVTNEQIEQYIQEQQQAQQALDEQEMLEEFEQKRIEMGLEGASLTLDDIRSLMNSFAAEEQQQEALEAKMKAEQKLQMLRTMSRLKLEELSEHLKSQELDKDKKQIVANLKLIDLDRLSAKDAVFLIGMVNNIVKNDRWGGARTFSEEVGSSERAIALMQEFAAMRKKLPKPKAARNATEQVVMMMRRFFGEYSNKIAEASGMDGILNASAQANRMAEEIHKARDKYAKSVGYKDTELNRYRAQAYAYLQSVEGDTQEQQQASFEKLRNDLLESARMLMDPTRDTHRVKFPDLYIQAVAEVAEPARSLDEVKVAEPIRKMVEWEQQQHAKDYAMHAQAAELDHNKRMGYVRAYTARGYFETDRFTETQQNRDPSILERFFDGTTVKERLAGSKMDRVGRRPSQIVDLDFFSVQDSARRELYMDTFGARYIARMRGVLTDPRLFEGDNPVMTRATRDIMTQRVRSLIKADQVVADVFSDKWTKAYNKVSRRASAIALVGSGAFIKQLTPLVSTFFHVRPSELVQGMRDATQTHREGTWQNNIAKTQTIYERAQVMAGLERIGETVARKAVLRGDENRAMELSKLLYTEAGHLSKEYGRRTIAFGDAWAATATWWAFYRQYIRKAGLENTNWKAELNEQAAAYASDREQFMQGANIPEANAPMYRNVKLFQRVVLDIFFSFNSFNLNNLNRMSHDIKDIRFGSPEARKRGYIDLAARLFEMAAFRATADALRIYATLFLADLILEAIGDDPEDDRARRADADAKKYDYWVRLLADVGMDFAFTGMGDIPTNVVKDGFNTIVNLAERDTGPKKRNYDLYYVSDKDSYGVLGILYGQASNLFKAAEVMSMYKGVEGKEAKRMRDEAMILAALSVAHLAGYTDQTITRGLEREIVRRLPYQVMHKREERFGQVLGKALYDLIDQDEPYTPSDTYENY